MDPTERFPIAACLKKVYSLRPSHNNSVNSGSTTPTQQPALDSGIKRDDETPTIVLTNL
jgi:hypothetical protein